MPTGPEPTAPSPKLDRNLLEQLLFGAGRARRFTQDSPVLPDVWIEYAKGVHEAAEDLSVRVPLA